MIYETKTIYFAANLKPSFKRQRFAVLSAPSQPPAQRLMFGWPMADIARFTNSSYLLTYLLTYCIVEQSIVSFCTNLIFYQLIKGRQCRYVQGGQ